MLSDSLHESVELIWKSIEDYDYSKKYGSELIEVLSKLEYIIYQLDTIKNLETNYLSFENIKLGVKKRFVQIFLKKGLPPLH